MNEKIWRSIRIQWLLQGYFSNNKLPVCFLWGVLPFTITVGTPQRSLADAVVAVGSAKEFLQISNKPLGLRQYGCHLRKIFSNSLCRMKMIMYCFHLHKNCIIFSQMVHHQFNHHRLIKWLGLYNESTSPVNGLLYIYAYSMLNTLQLIIRNVCIKSHKILQSGQKKSHWKKYRSTPIYHQYRYFTHLKIIEADWCLCASLKENTNQLTLYVPNFSERT